MLVPLKQATSPEAELKKLTVFRTWIPDKEEVMPVYMADTEEQF